MISPGLGPVETARPVQPSVLQIFGTFLRRSENWVYEQTMSLERYHAVFGSRHRQNQEWFPLDELACIDDLPLHARLWDRAVRKRKGFSPFMVTLARDVRPVLIHAHFGPVAAGAVGVAKAIGVPLVASFYGVDMWKHAEGAPGLRRRYADLFAHAAVCLVEGPAAGARLIEIGCDPARIATHRLGVDVRSIGVQPRRPAEGGALCVLMASRFVEKKGLRYGVEAFARVARDNPAMRLTIVGKGTSAREAAIANELNQIARRHGVSEQVRIHGFMPLASLVSLARSHHLLMHPSVHAEDGDAEGGHPVVMTLLAAGGMPILATRHCDIPAIVSDGETGWLVDERDSSGLEAILREIVADPSVLPAFGRRARELVEANYDIRQHPLDDVYDRVLKLT